MRTSRLLLLSCLLIAALGCSDERSDRSAEQRPIDTLRTQTDSVQPQTKMLRDSLRRLSVKIRKLKEDLAAQKKLRPLLLDNRVGLWEPDEHAMYIHFADSVDAQTVPDLVNAFNRRFAGRFNLELLLQSTEGAAARVEVSDDTRLGEQMGSAGSRMYLATMTYTLTSLSRIDSVYLDIEEGSHASPGYYSRKTWVDLVQEE